MVSSANDCTYIFESVVSGVVRQVEPIAAGAPGQTSSRTARKAEDEHSHITNLHPLLDLIRNLLWSTIDSKSQTGTLVRDARTDPMTTAPSRDTVSASLRTLRVQGPASVE